MNTVPTPAHERAYPLPAPADDRRFSYGLLFDVARILAEHGYPPITAGGDLVALQQALFGFLYAPAESFCHGAPAGFEGDCGMPGPHQEHRYGGRGPDRVTGAALAPGRVIDSRPGERLDSSACAPSTNDRTAR